MAGLTVQDRFILIPLDSLIEGWTAVAVEGETYHSHPFGLELFFSLPLW